MTNHIHTNNVIKQLITVYMLSLFFGGGAAGFAIIGFAAWPCRRLGGGGGTPGESGRLGGLGGGGGTLGDWITSSGHGDLGDLLSGSIIGDLGSSSVHGDLGDLRDLLRRGIARPSECDPEAFALDLVAGTIVCVGEGVASDIGEGLVGDDEGVLGASERSAVYGMPARASRSIRAPVRGVLALRPRSSCPRCLSLPFFLSLSFFLSLFLRLSLPRIGTGCSVGCARGSSSSSLSFFLCQRHGGSRGTGCSVGCARGSSSSSLSSYALSGGGCDGCLG
jgi:hypothetical protein